MVPNVHELWAQASRNAHSNYDRRELAHWVSPSANLRRIPRSFLGFLVPVVKAFGLKHTRERHARHGLIDPQKRVVADGVEILFDGHNLTVEQPVQTACVQIAPLKRLWPEVGPQRRHKALIGAPIGRFTVRKTSARH